MFYFAPLNSVFEILLVFARDSRSRFNSHEHQNPRPVLQKTPQSPLRRTIDHRCAAGRRISPGFQLYTFVSAVYPKLDAAFINSGK